MHVCLTAAIGEGSGRTVPACCPDRRHDVVPGASCEATEAEVRPAEPEMTGQNRERVREENDAVLKRNIYFN